VYYVLLYTYESYTHQHDTDNAKSNCVTHCKTTTCLNLSLYKNYLRKTLYILYTVVVRSIQRGKGGTSCMYHTTQHTYSLQLHSTTVFLIDFVLQKCIVLLQFHDFIHIKQGGGMLRSPVQNRLELVKPTSVGNRSLFVQTCRH